MPYACTHFRNMLVSYKNRVGEWSAESEKGKKETERWNELGSLTKAQLEELFWCSRAPWGNYEFTVIYDTLKVTGSICDMFATHRND